MGSQQLPGRSSGLTGTSQGGAIGTRRPGAAADADRKFLDRLPSAVIRSGRVIPVRSDIAALMGKRPSPKVSLTAERFPEHCEDRAKRNAGFDGGEGRTRVECGSRFQDAGLERVGEDRGEDSWEGGANCGSACESAACKEQGGSPRVGELAFLRVKSVDGKQVYVLRLHSDDTVADLREQLNRCGWENYPIWKDWKLNI